MQTNGRALNGGVPAKKRAVEASGFVAAKRSAKPGCKDTQQCTSRPSRLSNGPHDSVLPAVVPFGEVCSSAYWKRLCPMLHVCSSDFIGKLSAPTELSATRYSTLHDQLANDGFFTLDSAELRWPVALSKLTEGIGILQSHGWPATMMLVYDETWAVVHHLSTLMASVSGGNTNCFDILLWSINASEGQAGFAPHRDRQPQDVAGSFRPDGSPKYHTAWIALSEAAVDNSCLYVIPAQQDPGYHAGDDHSCDAEDPLQKALRSDTAVQSIRACPLRAGGALIFSHRIMHWGSRGDVRCAEPRVSLSFGCSDAAFERPYLRNARAQLPYPAVGLRLALAAAQLINYHERFNFDGALLARFGRIFERRKRHFTKHYRQKTAAELKSACEDRRDEDDETLDPALDTALDAMLDAQIGAGGYLYHDDFDDLEESD